MSKKISLKIEVMPNGTVSVEKDGTPAEIAQMLAFAMANELETISIVSAAIPTALDLKKIDRLGFCNQIVNAVGLKVKP